MILGVVPCAGASTRMGQPKALLQAGGETFVAAVVRALREGGCDSVIVVVPEDPTLERAAASTGATVLVNSSPGEGPITSLRLVLDEISDPVEGLVLAGVTNPVEGLVYLPVDHPMVRADTVADVIAAARTAGSPLVVPTLEGSRGHPAYFGAALFDELADPRLAGGARTVVHRHLGSATLLPVDDPGICADIDTPGAYVAAFERHPDGHVSP